MGEVVPFDAGSRRSVPSLPPPTQEVPFEMYLAYRQAEEAFRAIHFGRPLDIERMMNRASTRIVQRHWSAVQQLAETLLKEKSLSREQVIKVLLHASLDAATDLAMSAQP